jgi:hypothetical protein
MKNEIQKAAKLIKNLNFFVGLGLSTEPSFADLNIKGDIDGRKINPARNKGIPADISDNEKQNPKKSNDDLIEALKKIITDQKVICFDEFQVLDVADAMLLARIFEYFFSKQITVVITANLHPQNLYKNGLQREVFLEFVNNVLLKKIEVLNLNSPTDYRKHNRDKLTKRFFVSNPKNRQIFQEIIEDFTNNKSKNIVKLESWGREIIVKKAFENVAIFNFNELFEQNYSSADFKEICQKFDLIFTHSKKILELKNAKLLPIGGCHLDSHEISLEHEKNKLISMMYSFKNFAAPCSLRSNKSESKIF